MYKITAWGECGYLTLIVCREKNSVLLQIQFLIFKPRSHCFEETIEFDVKVSFASHPMSRLIRWYNKPGDITKEFWQKVIQFHGTFHGLKITSWIGILIKLFLSQIKERKRKWGKTIYKTVWVTSMFFTSWFFHLT